MKAVQVKNYGGSEVLEIVDDIAIPTPGSNQIQVKVYGASINPFDIKLSSGMFKDYMKIDFPYTPGGDFAGIVLGLGEGVSEFKPGDKVFGSANFLTGGSGSFAQILVANCKNSALMPTNLDFVESASLPLISSSAIQSIEEEIKLTKGQKILIQGGAGGIGSFAIQLAKHIGAYIAVTVSKEQKEYVKSLGADLIIDYKQEDFLSLVSEYDAVFDLVGGEIGAKSLKVLKKGGILATMVGEPDMELAESLEVRAVGIKTQTESGHLKRAKELIEKGVILPKIDKVFPLEEARNAFEYLSNERVKGKVVLKV